MARSTPISMRNQVMYQIFIRNFSPEGTFAAVRPRLDAIRDMGVDIIWLMPIHPVGRIKRKGSLGSPYAISDYRAVNPEFGTMEDFTALVDDIHAHGMKCIIDVVYNHTSPDSILAAEHPEWFYHKADGSFGNRVGDWSDIIDLDYSNKELWDYQIDTLKMWAGIVDGFRCDVAPLVPLDFWLRARDEVERVRPGCVWLSESVEPPFITYIRGMGWDALSDSEIYQAFDIAYDYDIMDDFRAALRGDTARYAEALNRQESMYPANYIKLRFLENHDQPRAAFIIPDERALRNWTALIYFSKGMTLLYAGQEFSAAHKPTLFDKDTVTMEAAEGKCLIPLMTRLARIKRDTVFTDSVYHAQAKGRFITATHRSADREALGVFSTKGETGRVEVDFEDGVYTDLITGEPAEVFARSIVCRGEPIVIIK